ncbi:DNA double-strand break repair nuclease NurA [soil metagenome]
MPLDLNVIMGQINDMAGTLDSDELARRFDALDNAWSNLDSVEVNERYDTAITSFLLAETSEDYRGTTPLTEVPDNYSVAASDGSFILPDRHAPLRFFLLNTSTVYLKYGAGSTAEISTLPDIRYQEADLIVPNDPQRTPIDGTILGFLRAIEELKAACTCLEGREGATVALQDGTLVLWQVQGQSDLVKDWILEQFIDVLDEFRKRDQPVASYISAPGATELMNMLRVAVCDYPEMGKAIDCKHCRSQPGRVPACDVLPNIPDRTLLTQIAKLQPGERTSVYHSRSKIMRDYDRDRTGDQKICFFYLNAGREIARVEIPRWVAADVDQLELVHNVIYDQCSLGRGYPVVLQEAHEAAVLSMSDRRMIEVAIEQALSNVGIMPLHTGKDGSKRGRFV